MFHNVSFIRSQKYFLATTSGMMSGDGFVALGSALLEHPDWLPGRNVVFDHRDLTFTEAKLSDLEMIRKFHRQYEKKIGNGRSAIVLKQGSTEAWQRVWEQGRKIQSSNIVKLFENLNLAIQWICEG
jgi:hypothetical protein